MCILALKRLPRYKTPLAILRRKIHIIHSRGWLHTSWGQHILGLASYILRPALYILRGWPLLVSLASSWRQWMVYGFAHFLLPYLEHPSLRWFALFLVFILIEGKEVKQTDMGPRGGNASVDANAMLCCCVDADALLRYCVDANRGRKRMCKSGHCVQTLMWQRHAQGMWIPCDTCENHLTNMTKLNSHMKKMLWWCLCGCQWGQCVQGFDSKL